MSNKDTDYVVVTVPPGTVLSDEILTELRDKGVNVHLEESIDGHYQVVEVVSSFTGSDPSNGYAAQAMAIIQRVRQKHRD